MAAVKGCGAAFFLGTDQVLSLTSISNPLNRDSLDITSFDSSCVREFIGGLLSMTIDISGYYNEADTTGQKALYTAIIANTTLTSTQKPKILWDGTNGITADADITNITTDAAVDGIVNFSCSLQCTGTIAVV